MRAWIAAAAAVAALGAPAAHAMCPGMFAPDFGAVHPDDHTFGLVTYSEGTRTEVLVLEPSFHGTAGDFGMVLPLPSRPEIAEARPGLFEDLEFATGAFPPWGGVPNSESFLAGAAEGVRVVEQKTVGSFDTAVLTASDPHALAGWLDGNGYAYSEADAANFAYYVEKGGYYFVAMKVAVGAAPDGTVDGRLDPVSFEFESEAPMLPLRIMASDMDAMDFTLYTLGDWPLYVPGAGASHVSTVHEGSLAAEALEGYSPEGRWLLRTDVTFDPRQVSGNLLLSRAADLPKWRTGMLLGAPLTIDPLAAPAGAGIVLGEAGPRVAHTEPFALEVRPAMQQAAGVPPESVECAPRTGPVVSPDGSRSVCAGPESASRLAGLGWEISDHRAAELARLA